MGAQKQCPYNIIIRLLGSVLLKDINFRVICTLSEPIFLAKSASFRLSDVWKSLTAEEVHMGAIPAANVRRNQSFPNSSQ